MILYDNIKIETSKVHVWREKGMERSESIYRQSKQELEDVQQKLRMIGYELGTMDLHRKSIIRSRLKEKYIIMNNGVQKGKYIPDILPLYNRELSGKKNKICFVNRNCWKIRRN